MDKQHTSQNFERDLTRTEHDPSRNTFKDEIWQRQTCIQSVIDDMEECYYEVDLRGRYRIVNAAFIELFGYKWEELTGFDNRAHQTLDMAAKTAESFKKAYKTGKRQKAQKWECLHKNGTIVKVEGSVNLLRAPDGQNIGFFGTLRDITQRTLTQLALRDSEDKYRTIVQSMGDAYFEVDVRGYLTLINPAFSNMIGMSVKEIVGRSYRELQTEAAANRVFEIFHSVFLTRCTVPNFEWELLHRDGRSVTGEGSVQPVFDERGWVSGFRGTLRDVTERRRNEQALRNSEQRFRALAQLSNDWFWELDADLRYHTLAGRGGVIPDAQDEFIGKLVWETALEVEAPRSWATVRTTMKTRMVFRDVTMSRKLGDGRPYFVSVSGEPVFENEVFKGYRGISREITKEKLAESRVLYLANHDVLTDLPNRLMLSQLLADSILKAQRTDTSFTVLFIDLDSFKFVNDSLGHSVGDALLKEMATRFRASLGAGQTLARFGGDEFVALLPDESTPTGVDAVAMRLLAVALQPLMLQGQECRISASIGVARFPDHGADEQTLMKNADAAMYFAKDAGKNTVQVYSDAIRVRSMERFSIESQLRGALERNEFTLHYQPQIELASNEIVGVEALLRWNHPLLGSVSPLRFIGIAEETGLIVPIGKWVLHEACRQSMAWRDEGLPSVCMAVNLSTRQFVDERFLADLASVLERTGLPPHLLELEITEGMMAQDPEGAARLLHAIKASGVRLAIDDFGTGYSSLAQLKAFPIDTLKIDRSFIQEVATSPQDQAITRAIIAMGKSLSLTVVAEGVETFAQEQFLREQSCDQMQGYLFSKPVAAKAFANLIRASLT